MTDTKMNKCLICGKETVTPRRLTCSNEHYEEARNIIRQESLLLNIWKQNLILRELGNFLSKEASASRKNARRKKTYYTNKLLNEYGEIAHLLLKST